MTVLNGIDRINDHLYVGGDPRYCRNLAADIDLLNEHVDLIIDCRSDGEHYDGWDEEEGVTGPAYIHVPMYDDFNTTNSTDDFISAWNQVNEMIMREELPTNPVLFVHCHMGVNRGPSMAMFFLIVEHQMSAREAFLAIRKARFGTGIAYADVAIQAAMDLLGNQDETDIELWENWERQYWYENRNAADVKYRISQNRYGNQNAWTDDQGIVHVTQGERA